MDTRTGEINHIEYFKQMLPRMEFEQFIRPVDWKALSPELQAEFEKTGRTKVSKRMPCPCGSGRKFKRCCMVK
jgi:uncharacterized protein YecA (UPF0149 family)